MDEIYQDFRYSFRLLTKTPLSTCIAILSIALGIGANAVVFSAIHNILLKSLPYKEPERVVLVWGTSLEDGSLSNRNQVSATDIDDLRKSNTVFEDVATFTGWMPVLSGYGEAERLPAIQVGDGYFKILKGKALLGRVFTPQEQQDGKDFVIVLSYSLWSSRFGKDPKIIGRRIYLNARPYTIIGVMPPDFHSLPSSLVAPQGVFYRPVAEPLGDSHRDEHHLRAIARLKPGVTLQQAEAQVRWIAKQMEQAHPMTNNGRAFHLASITEDTVGSIRPALWTLFAAVAFVLAIACANVANLLLVRATVRQKELTIRCALGAGRRRIVQQLLTESLLLSFGGGLVGFLFAFWGIRWVRLFAGGINPLLTQISLNIPVLLFAFAVSLITGLLFGLAPALHAGNPNLTDALKQGGSGSTGGTGRSNMRNVLLVSEVAMAMVLLFSAVLLVQTMFELRKVKPGFSSENLLAMSIGLPGIKYPEEINVRKFYDTLLSRIQNLPGVRAAGLTSVLPLSGNFDGRGIEIEGRPVPRGQELSADMYVVSSGYLKAMQIPLLNGRTINERDDEHAMHVALVNETMAKQVWPNQNPIGRRIRLIADQKETPWCTIVGVVADVSQYALEQKPPLQFYVSFDQSPSRFNDIVIKTEGDASSFYPAVRNALKSVDKDQAAYNVVTVESLLADSIALKRFLAILLVSFSFVAVLLAALGFYGVMAYSVAQRKREIGIRMALGGTRRHIWQLVIGEAIKLTAGGLVLGSVVALSMSRLLASLLFHVKAANVANLLPIGLLLLAVSVAACLVPALRAMKVAPATSLRYE